MGARQLFTAGVGVALCLLTAACSSLRNSTDVSDSAPTHTVSRFAPVLGHHDFAVALAHYGEAMRLEMQGQHAAALSNYVVSATLDPSNEALQFRVALALIQDKRNDEAVALMEKAAKANPRSDRMQVWLALVYRSSGHEDLALAAYERAIVLAPTSSVAHIERAALLARQGRGTDAIRNLESTVTLVGTNEQADIVRVLGELYLREAAGAAQSGKRWPHMGEARKRMEAGAKTWPDDQALLLMLGNLRALDNDIPGAIALYDDLERRNPDDLMIKEKLAFGLMAAGNKTGAVVTLERIAVKQPTNGKVFYLLGDLYEQLGQTNNAILNYNLAGKNSPDDPLPFLKSSMLSMAAGKPGEAEAILRKGLEGAPSQLRLREMLGYVLMMQKKFDQSVEVFAKAAESLGKPEAKNLTQNFLINYAIALQLDGKIPESADMLGAAMKTNGAAVDVFASYILQEGSSNEIADAANVLALLEKNQPGEARPAVFHGLLLNALDRHAEGVEAFARAEKNAKNSVESAKILTASFYFWYASACERTTNILRAAPLFLKCIELNPDNAPARNYLAYMWAEHATRLDEALLQIRKALESDPDNPAYRDTLAWIHFQRGDTEKALVEIQKAVEKMNDDDVVNDHYGDILAKMGRRKEAVELWKKAYICGNETEGLAIKLRTSGVDPRSLDEAAAAAFRAKLGAAGKPQKK